MSIQTEEIPKNIPPAYPIPHRPPPAYNVIPQIIQPPTYQTFTNPPPQNSWVRPIQQQFHHQVHQVQPNASFSVHPTMMRSASQNPRIIYQDRNSQMINSKPVIQVSSIQRIDSPYKTQKIKNRSPQR